MSDVMVTVGLDGTVRVEIRGDQRVLSPGDSLSWTCTDAADLRERLAAAIEAMPPYDVDQMWVLRLSASNLVRNRP